MYTQKEVATQSVEGSQVLENLELAVSLSRCGSED